MGHKQKCQSASAPQTSLERKPKQPTTRASGRPSLNGVGLCRLDFGFYRLIVDIINLGNIRVEGVSDDRPERDRRASGLRMAAPWRNGLRGSAVNAEP
jgi:hypothetical protein